MGSFDYSDEFLEHMAELFQAFSSETRLKILRALHLEEDASGEGLSVRELQEAVGTSQANVSRHLKLMEEQGLLAGRAEGNRREYRIASEEVTMICDYVCGYMEDRLRDMAELAEDSHGT